MDNFNLYANYYDLLYNQKDYLREVHYVKQLIDRFSALEVKEILDFGCGTGKHANLLSEYGLHIDGVDIAPSMIELALESYSSNNKLTFYQGDIRSCQLGKKYDAVVSLFHVLSYQNSNEDVLSTFKNVGAHLKEKGLFIFDFWYGPGVLTDPPEVRIKSFENNEINVTRKAIPVVHSDRNVVDVNYEVNIQSKDLSKSEQITETHSMRYLFKPELDYYLAECGFDILELYHWLTQDEPDLDSWNAVVIAKKK